MCISGKFDKNRFLLTIANIAWVPLMVINPKNIRQDRSLFLKINQREILNSTMCRF